jgi:hypothetical protein
MPALAARHASNSDEAAPIAVVVRRSDCIAASGDELAIKWRNRLEHRLGQQASLIAQKRSKEILEKIEKNKRAQLPARETPR